jgi:two-component system chemotaxis response regulator CheB
MISDKIISKQGGFEGTLKNFRLIDLIQMCCMAGATTAIRVTQDLEQGIIMIRDGAIVQAMCDEIFGEEAFYKIISWKKGSFETLDISPVLEERMIDKDWEFLLLEGTRMRDEQAITGGGLEGPEEKLPASPVQDNVRVLIVDDSPLMCRILQELLTSDESITVVGVAHDGEEALKKIDEIKPNLITLDVNMPVMDGGTALKHIMIKKPCPTVIISKLGSKPPENILDFLRLGAVDFILKPKKSEDMGGHHQQLIERIKLAAKVKIENFKRVRPPKISLKAKDSFRDESPCESLVVVSSATGGYAELIKLLSLLPGNLNASLILLQGMPREFQIPFSDYLNSTSGLRVLPIQDNSPLFGGRCYLSTNDVYIKISSEDNQHSLRYEADVSNLKQKPFDHLLCSIANNFPRRILVVLLSGAEVGDLEGLQNIKQRKGQIIAQKLNSCLAPHSLQKAIQANLVDLEGDDYEMAMQISQSP